MKTTIQALYIDKGTIYHIKPTGAWRLLSTRDEMYIEVIYTKKVFFRDKEVTKWIREDEVHIRYTYRNE